MDVDGGSGHNRGGSLYCSNCGTGLEPSMNYCPTCGTPSSRADTRPHAGRETNTGSGSWDSVSASGANGREGSSDDVTDRDILELRIAEALRDGWRLEHDFGDHAVMVRRSFGSLDAHLVVGLITVWFTMGIGNALYGAYRYFGDAERMVLQADHIEKRDDDESTVAAALLWRATAAVCWVAAATAAVIGLQFVAATASLLLFALAFAFAALGVSVLPSVQHRLENRHSVAANGRVRSVDERAVVAYDRPCAACADPVGRGLERTYRKEFCVLGVPLTTAEGRNYYCKQCATAEPSPSAERDRRATESPSGSVSDRGSESSDTDRDPDHA